MDIYTSSSNSINGVILGNMFLNSRNGITVFSMLDIRKPNAKNEYPIKIRVNFKRKREYYSIARSLSKKE